MSEGLILLQTTLRWRPSFSGTALTVSWARGARNSTTSLIYQLSEGPLRHQKGSWCVQRASWIWIWSLKRRIEPGACKPSGTKYILCVLQNFGTPTGVMWGDALWRGCGMTCLEISCFFQVLTMSGMSSAHRGCRATPLGGDQGCGRPPVSGLQRGWLWLIPNRCLQQGAWKQSDFNINSQHLLESWKGDIKSLACWLFVFVAQIHLSPV